MREGISISRSAVVDSSIDSVWQVVADPLNAAIYLDPVIDVEKVRDNLYMVREVISPETEGLLAMNEYLMEVIESEEKKSQMFRIHLDLVRRKDFGFMLEPQGKEKTNLTCRTELNFVSVNNQEIEREIDSIIVKIVKMTVKRPLPGMFSRYEGTL